MLRRWSLLWLVAFFAAGCLSSFAQGSSGGASSPRANVSWTVSYTGGAWKVSGTVTVSNSGGRYGVAILDPVTGDGGTKDGDRVASYDASISPGTFPYEYTLTPGKWYRWIANDSEGPGQNFDQDTDFFQIPSAPPPTYEVKVVLPMNREPTKAIYFAMQNGEQIDSHVLEHAQGPYEWTIGPLETNAPVIVVRYAGGEIFTDGEGGWVKAPGGQHVPVTPSMTPSLSGSGSSAYNAAGQGTNPNQPTPTTPPAAPTPTTPPAAPAATTPPAAPKGFFPSFSATDPTATTSGDAGSDQVTDAINAQMLQDHTIGLSIIEGLEVQTLTQLELGAAAIESTDKIAEQVHSVGSKQIEATDKVAASVQAAAEAQVEVGNVTNIQLAIIAQQALAEGASSATASEEAAAAAEEAQAEGAAAAAAAVAVLPEAPDALGYGAPEGGSAAFLTVEMPAAFGGATINFNPFAYAGMASIAAWFRAATEWLCLLLLGQFVFAELRKSLDTVATTRQATGNPVVGGTGAQGTAAVNAGLITAAALVLLAALVAWSFDSVNFAGLVANLTASPLVGMGADVFWFLDQFLPLMTMIVCAVARAAWHLYSGPVIITYVTVCRWFIA